LKQPAIQFFGGDGEEVTPVPIPNTEVKLFSADGTARATVWESRTPPKISIKARPTLKQGGTGFGIFPLRIFLSTLNIALPECLPMGSKVWPGFAFGITM
jgi:hypothetical protein